MNALFDKKGTMKMYDELPPWNNKSDLKFMKDGLFMFTSAIYTTHTHFVCMR